MGDVTPIRPDVTVASKAAKGLKTRLERMARITAAMAFEAELKQHVTAATAIDTAYHALLAAAHELEEN